MIEKENVKRKGEVGFGFLCLAFHILSGAYASEARLR